VNDRLAVLPTARARVLSTDRRLLGSGMLILLGIGLAYASASGAWARVLGLLAVSSAVVIGIRNWRWSIYGLLLYLPISGIPSILTYPGTQLAVVAKDVLFVVPAYLGFAIAARKNPWRFRGFPILPLAGFTVLAAIQSLNPALPNFLVALIGLKVWFFYIPLFLLGYHFVASRSELQSLLKVISWAAVIPAAVGIVEALLIYGGQSKFVYGFYGAAAAASTQNFVMESYIGGGFTARVPSTFPFVFQYYMFAGAMVAVTYAWWRLGRRPIALVLWILMLVAAFTSGARGAFIMIPLLILLIVLLDGRFRGAATAFLVVGAALFVAISLVGAVPSEVLGRAGQIGVKEVQEGFFTGMVRTVQVTTLGLGTGSATIASRYAFPDQAPPPAYGLTTSESWWVKLILELGIPGLVLMALVLARLVGRLYVQHRRLQDAFLRGVTAALLAYLVWILVYGAKGMYLDLDPTNIYFWLFGGVLARAVGLPSALAGAPWKMKHARVWTKPSARNAVAAPALQSRDRTDGRACDTL
jgi:hypothetical protein